MRGRAPIPLIAGIALALPACSLLRVRREHAALEAGLAKVDALLERRADRATIEEARERLDLLALDHADPRILARQARCDHALGYGFEADPPGELSLYQSGRERAWRCLYDDPAFAGVLTSTGGRIGPAAVSRIAPERAECAVWLVANWSRWLLAKDPAAYAIDVKPLSLLAERAAELAEGGDLAGLALGYLALSRALLPIEFGPDLDAASAAFARAIAADPGNLTVQVDLAERVHLQRDDRERLEATLADALAAPEGSDERWALENARARRRAHALLEAQKTTPDRAR